MFRHLYTWVFLLACCWGLTAQNGSNPFEIPSRLVAQDTLVSTIDSLETAEENASTNPFELGYTKSDTENPPPVGNPFELNRSTPAAPRVEDLPPAIEPVEEIVVQSDQATATEGALLVITLLIFLLGAACLVFFRGLYAKAYRAVFNDHLLSQLYREREAGNIGAFFITYAVFFIAGALFLYLVLDYQGVVLPGATFWSTYLLLLGGLSGLFVVKHLLLSLVGYIFPIGNEISRYSFTIMVFAIVISLILLPMTLVLAYVTAPGLQQILIYGVLGIVFLLYIMRSVRGIFIANRFIFNHSFHFLSYLCAVEIGPTLCLFKYFTGF